MALEVLKSTIFAVPSLNGCQRSLDIIEDGDNVRMNRHVLLLIRWVAHV